VATKALHPLYIGEDPASPKGERLGYVLEMARSCGISLSDPRPKLTVDDAEALSVLRRHNYGRNSRPYIGIHLGPTVPVREWPFESWRQLVELLRQRLEATIFQFGSKWHSSHPGEMEETLPVQINLTNRLNLIETTQLISKMDLFIGIDSGLLHIANATGVPLIGLFGPTDPAIVIPGHPTAGLFSAELPCIFCQHRGLNLHWKTGCPYDIQCMHLLSSDLVFAKAKAILQSTSPSPNVEK
jgi:ADP-heptose:LPS heptosyltransferase